MGRPTSQQQQIRVDAAFYDGERHELVSGNLDRALWNLGRVGSRGQWPPAAGMPSCLQASWLPAQPARRWEALVSCYGGDGEGRFGLAAEAGGAKKGDRGE